MEVPWSRGLIRAAAASLRHSHVIPESCLQPTSQLTAMTDFFFFLSFSMAAPAAYGDSQARGLIGAVAASLHQSHSNIGSEPRLRPTPQLTATLDP